MEGLQARGQTAPAGQSPSENLFFAAKSGPYAHRLGDLSGLMIKDLKPGADTS